MLQRFVKIWRIQIFFPHNVAIWVFFPPKQAFVIRVALGIFNSQDAKTLGSTRTPLSLSLSLFSLSQCLILFE
jgi:hypothetical protein